MGRELGRVAGRLSTASADGLGVGWGRPRRGSVARRTGGGAVRMVGPVGSARPAMGRDLG